MPDITKLPKWAQQHITALERDLDRAQLQLEEFQSGSLINAERQKFYVEDGTGMDEGKFWLPQYGRLKFTEDPLSDNRTGLEIDQARNPGHAGVEVRSSFGGRIAVVPIVSNSVRIMNVE